MLHPALFFALFGFALAQNFNEFQFADPFGETWSFPNPQNSFSRRRDVEEVTERDRESLSPTYEDPVDTQREREPLSPNYEDPIGASSEENPVLKPKPDPAGEGSRTFNSGVLPGGVIDVDAVAGGFPQDPIFQSSGFGFSSFGDVLPPPKFGGGLGGFFGNLGQYKPWWKGPNVCITRSETNKDQAGQQQRNETDSEPPNFFSTAISLSNCHETANKYECVTKINNHGDVKTFTVEYKCCYGFARTNKSSGCEEKIELKSLLETIEGVGAKEFNRLIKDNGMESIFSEGNFTVFVPSDAALKEFNDKMLELNNIDLATDTKKSPVSNVDLVLSEAVPGFIDLTDLSNEDTINSENNNSSIRINIYPTQNYEKLVTVNCARVTKANNFASNGIVNVIEGVALPATQSLEDVIKDSRKLTSFKKILESTESFKNLRENGHYTIFAPSDEAFDKVDGGFKQKLLRGDACAISVLKYHVTSHTICSSAIVGNVTTHNIEGEILNLERTPDDQIILEDKARITDRDIIATNGVIHLIDEVLIPDSALHISAVLANENLTKFNELVQQAGLTDEINSLVNATVFAPSDEAFKEARISKLLEEIKGDQEKLKDLVRYHTVAGQLQSSEMTVDGLLTSNDHGQKLRLNLYSTLPLFTNVINRATINCARLIGFDERACGSVIHEVDQVLLPPSEDILEVIQGDSKYSTLVELLKGTEVEKILKEANRSMTLLAPTDETFAAIEEADLKIYKEDKEKANNLLKNHILPEVLCCSGVGPQSWGFNNIMQTMSNQHLQVGKNGQKVHVGRAVITNCDNLATNGVVQTINKVLFPQRATAPNFGGFFLFDF